MKKYIISIIFLLGFVSCQNHQENERKRIKAAAVMISERILKNCNGTIGKSQFWEESEVPNTYSIGIILSREYSLEEVKNIVSSSFSVSTWSIIYTWQFVVDRYSCSFYDTSTNIAITYGYHPTYPNKLLLLVYSYSTVKKTAN